MLSGEYHQKLSAAALSLSKHRVIYDPAYYWTDLQNEVHEDMKANFEKYPKSGGWNLLTQISIIVGYKILWYFLKGMAW